MAGGTSKASRPSVSDMVGEIFELEEKIIDADRQAMEFPGYIIPLEPLKPDPAFALLQAVLTLGKSLTTIDVILKRLLHLEKNIDVWLEKKPRKVSLADIHDSQHRLEDLKEDLKGVLEDLNKVLSTAEEDDGDEDEDEDEDEDGDEDGDEDR
ncbi:MAG: hypothetical protein V3U53_07220 [bacterium]